MTAAVAPVLAYASPIDAGRFGEHRSAQRARPAFTARLGSTRHPVESGRYHLYCAWSCPSSHRVDILRRLVGAVDDVSLSHVHGLRDARGWAFRPQTGADLVNGFTVLREAYERSAPGYDGQVSVPLLWDRIADRAVSNDPVAIGIDLTRFGTGVDPYPYGHAAEIDALGRRIEAEVAAPMARAMYDGVAARALLASLAGFDRLLAGRRFLAAGRLTDADVRLWVHVVRYDTGANAYGTVGPRLDSFAALWRWAAELSALDAFAGATDFQRFAASGADLPPWPVPRTLPLGRNR